MTYCEKENKRCDILLAGIADSDFFFVEGRKRHDVLEGEKDD